ncbi:MAG: leucine-rich repeat domain-containing protein [Alphaproteobacteria bacterium]|nr:leucine-rich repeat domain-containing protein [Alphaproteobacteria bacterium]
MKKKILALGVMALPFCTEAYEGTIAQSGSCGATDADCHYDLYENGHLEIYGTGEMQDYSSASPSYPWKSNVTDINILGVTSIGIAAFYHTDITNLTIPNSVEQIGRYAFAWSPLQKIDIPNSVEEIGADAFRGSHLIDIIIPASVQKIGTGALSYCNHLETLIIDGNTELENIFQSAIDSDPTFFNFDNFKMYCSVANTSCRTTLQQAGATETQITNILRTYVKDGNRYIFEGKSYKTLSDMQNRIPVKRIYTIDEANAVAGEKNRVSIKYR